MISHVENIDCMIAMAKFPYKYFDLAIVDPPYGIKQDGKSNHSRGAMIKLKTIGQSARAKTKVSATKFTPKEWDREPPPKEYFSELKRVSKNQIIWGANHFIENLPPPINSSCWIVWDKVNGETHQSDCELAWTSFKTTVRKCTFKWNGLLTGDMQHKESRIHPTQKPIQLYTWLLQKYAKPGDKILDTHLGSGSSRIAAFNAGFDFWGYEIDKEYFDGQNERFNGHESTIFIDTKKPQAENLF